MWDLWEEEERWEETEADMVCCFFAVLIEWRQISQAMLCNTFRIMITGAALKKAVMQLHCDWIADIIDEEDLQMGLNRHFR